MVSYGNAVHIPTIASLPNCFSARTASPCCIHSYSTTASPSFMYLNRRDFRSRRTKNRSSVSKPQAASRSADEEKESWEWKLVKIDADMLKITLIRFSVHSGFEKKVCAKKIKKQPQSSLLGCWGTWVSQSTNDQWIKKQEDLPEQSWFWSDPLQRKPRQNASWWSVAVGMQA